MSRWLWARIGVALIVGPLASGFRLSAISEKHPMIAAATAIVMLSGLTVILTLVVRKLRAMPGSSERLIGWLRLGLVATVALIAAGFALAQA